MSILGRRPPVPVSSGVPLPRPGDVLAFRGVGLWAWVVRVFTVSDFHHVGLVIDGGEEPWVLESSLGRGVTIRPLATVKAEGRVYHLGMGCGWSRKDQTWAMARKGEKYSPVDAFLGLLARLVRWVRPIFPGWQCAELVQEALAARGVPGVSGIPATPDDLVFHLLSLGRPLRLLS